MFLIKTFDPSMKNNLKKETNYQPQMTTSKEVKRITFNKNKEKNKDNKKLEHKNINKIPTKTFNLFSKKIKSKNNNNNNNQV